MKAYQAHGPAGSVTRKTAAEAATAYFETFPKSRKCDVMQGEYDGYFFTMTFGRASEGRWPESYKNVTKKQAASLGQ